MIPAIIKECHEDCTGGHQGPLKTYKNVFTQVYWTIENDIYRFIVARLVEQRNKYMALSPARLLQPLPVPQQVWDVIIMDFIKGLLRSQGYSTILILVD